MHTAKERERRANCRFCWCIRFGTPDLERATRIYLFQKHFAHGLVSNQQFSVDWITNRFVALFLIMELSFEENVEGSLGCLVYLVLGCWERIKKKKKKSDNSLTGASRRSSVCVTNAPKPSTFFPPPFSIQKQNWAKTYIPHWLNRFSFYRWWWWWEKGELEFGGP